MFNAFYFKLACANIRRDKRTYLPHIIATAVISGVYLLIAGLMFSDGLSNVPSGETAQSMFRFGIVVFSIFAFFFMLYINNFLIGRRKKEFGLYGVLGLEKRHVGRVLFWENLLTLGAGVLLGAACALVFGRLIFWLLLKLIHTAPGSEFSISAFAYLLTALLFGAIFVVTAIANALRVRLVSPMELMTSPKKGEKDSKLLWPMAILGLLFLGAAYYLAWVLDSPGAALGLFFPLVILVILSTYALFTSGSVAFLKLMKANKRLYYRPSGFIAISGMIQRMKQNARSLATICILSTMLVVTISGTLSLYLGKEKMAREFNPFDLSFSAYYYTDDGEEPVPEKTEAALNRMQETVKTVAARYGVSILADESKLISRDQARAEGTEFFGNNVYDNEDDVRVANGFIRIAERCMCDFDVNQETGLAMVEEIRQGFSKVSEAEHMGYSISNIYTTRQDGYGLYGGLLFLGAFFGLLFLAVTVLIIYFKQISEGYEDKAQFEILRKVGMDDKQIKATINEQVLWVFFIPLGTTLLHMVFASKIMSCMLRSFSLNDYGLVLGCIGGVCAVFAALYLAVYGLTAKVYYNIIRT